MDLLARIDRFVRDVGNNMLDVYGQWRSHRYPPHRTIVLSCTGRGGSTWLAQIIQSVPGHQVLWEQLHWKSNPRTVEAGLGHPAYLRRDEDHPRVERFVREILIGRTLSHAINTRRYFDLRDLIHLRAYVAKFVTANMMLPWMVDRFQPRTIHLLRHPCAVVSSQLIHGEWDDVGPSFCYHPDLFDDFPHMEDVYGGLKSHEEVLAFNWAVQTFVPLNAAEPRRWFTTTYEHLVRHRIDEVKRIFDAIDEPVPSRIRSLMRKPSATTVSNSNVSEGRDPLKGWRERLTSEQIDAILRIAHDTGIEAYTDALVPDVDHLPGALPPLTEMGSTQP